MPRNCRARFCNRSRDNRAAGFRVSLVAVAWLICAPVGVAQEPSARELPASERQQVAIRAIRSAIQHEMQDKDLPALSIAVMVGGDLIWAEGFGFQDAERQIPASAETVYRVGSVSKLFTAIAAMQLVEQQQLDLDAPIQQYLPEFAPHNPHGTPVTLRQLMTHRSGLVREPPVGSYFDPDQPGMRETVASLNQTALVYPPATRTKYSNAAVTVVGAVVERQTGRGFAEHTHDAVFKPLKMNHTGFEVAPPIGQRLADGWMWTYDGRRFPAPTFLLGTAAAGNLYSNVVDLAGFLGFLFEEGQGGDEAILRTETLQAMLQPQRDANGQPLDYGLGFRVDRLDGHRRVGHGGAIYGFSTQLAALPDQKLGVVAVASLDVSNGVVGRITDYALRVMLAHQQGAALPPYPTSTAVAVERRAALVGSYRNENQSVEITALGDQVRLQQGTYIHRLRAAGDDGRPITDDLFELGTQVSRNQADSLLVGNHRYERRPDVPPAEVPAPWKGLVGEYGWDHNTLYILEDHGRLVALIEWFFHYPLTQVGEDEFAFPDYGLYHGEKLKFHRGGGGPATHVVAAEVTFPRRDALAEGQTFRITPVKPIEQLREQALQAQPPHEEGEFRQSDLVDITALDPTIKLDIRYATTNNFMGNVFYRQPRAFLQRPAAEALVRAHRRLEQRGLGLLIHDAYRPWHVTKMFWDATPGQFKDFVANPANGSRHNRGCAVDLTLYDRATGQPIQMVAEYDEFSTRSFPLYPGGTSRQRWYRDLLRRTMEAERFTVYEFEWWHFDYQDWQQYRIGNVTFEEI